jgi:hypothetical protein
MFRPSILVTLFAVVFAARAAEPHPSLPPPVIPDCLGVNIHFTDPKPGELEMLAAAGFKWVRMDFGWGGTERKKGEYDFSAYDHLVAALDKFKIRAVFILDYGNPLYADPGDSSPFTSRANTPEFREAFGKWAVAAVQHFKGRGYLWEMWNEPNGGFWKSPDKTGDYIALAKSTGEALRQAGLLGPKGEAFIGPATSTIDLPYLEACFQAGLLDYWDAVSVHPYRQNAPETVEEEYRSVRMLIRKYGPKDKVIPIISGEWGYSSAWPGMGKDEAARIEQQGKYLPREFLTNIANDVALSIWYDWHEDGTDPKEGEHHFGIVGHEYHPGRDPVYDPKPAYTAMKVLNTQLGGYRFNKTFRYFPEQRIPELYTDAEYFLTLDATPKYSCPEMQLWAADKSLALVTWSKTSKAEMGVFPAEYGQPSGVDYLGRALALPKEPKSEWTLTLGDRVEYRVFDEFEKPPWLLAGWKRVPLDTFETAPAKPKIEVSLTNPFAHRLVLPGWRESERLFEMPYFWDPGKYQEVYAESTELLAARKTVTRDFEIRLNRLPSSFVEQVPLEILYNPTRFVFTQSVHCRPLNPISVQFVGATGGKIVPWEKQLTDKKVINELNKAGLKPQREKTQLYFEITAEGEGPLPTKISLEYIDSDSGIQTGESPVIFEKGQKQAIAKIELDANISSNVLELGEIGSRRFQMENIQTLTFEPEKLRAGSDGDPKVVAASKLVNEAPSAGDCPLHTPSMKLTYRFGAGWKFAELSPHDRSISLSTKAPEVDKPRGFGFWLHGDGKGCQARIRFRDSTGQTFQPDGPKIDWKGWRYVTFPMQPSDAKSLAHWGGANDGQIHYPIQWDSIFLLDNPSRKPVEGEIYLSAPTLVY